MALPYTMDMSLSRRPLLALGAKACAVLSAACALPMGAWAGRVWAALTKPLFPTRTVELGGFGFDAATGEVVYSGGRRETYGMVMDGLVETPRTLSYAELRALPQNLHIADFHCVEGWSIEDVPWGGVFFTDVFRLVKPTSEARYVIFHSLGETRHQPKGWKHYVESFLLEDLVRHPCRYLLALDLAGEPLEDARGAPARVVCPYDLAYKSIKFVRRMEFSSTKQPGWWTMASSIYPWDARVPASRLRGASDC